ncbi:MAG: hypothetical protein PHO10_03070 [Gemmiger sp.]|nr:hypothetical protein [Gemmiger sp.]
MAMTGVYPVFKNVFAIGTKGRESSETDMKPVAEMESFRVTVDGNVEEWSPLEAAGWMKRMVTGKALSISLKGKRCVGDAGNDYVANNAWETGGGCDSKFIWTMPSGATLAFDCILNVSAPGGGESREMEGLEFEVLSSGKPVFTAAVAAS